MAKITIETSERIINVQIDENIAKQIGDYLFSAIISNKNCNYYNERIKK